MEILQQLFHQYTACEVERCKPLTPAGSNRRYYRLAAGNISLIGVVGTSVQENEAFIALAGQMHSKGLPVPQV